MTIIYVIKIKGEDLKKKLRIKDGKDGERGPAGSPESGEQTINKINDSKGFIDAKRIKNLPLSFMVGGGGKRVKGRQVRDDLSSQCDGARKTFTLTKPFVSGTVQLWGTQFPIVYRPVVDFTENSNGTITLTSEVGAPASGQTLVALYEKTV